PFIIAWSILVYGPVAHWVFSPEGWLFKKGALDFAGGTVVHINAGIAGVAMAIFLGRRRGWPKENMRPHNVPVVLLGAALLGGGCAVAVAIKGRVRIDDSLDVGAVHLIGGIIGSLSVGLLATADTIPLGADGLFYGGGWSLFGKQALAVVSVIGYTFVMTLVIA